MRLSWQAIIVHDRRPRRRLRPAEKYRPKGIVHCYSGSADDARVLARQGCISASAAPAPSRVPSGQQGHCALPLEQIVLETDCPYMAPEPVRGIRCDSSLIRYVGEYAASVKASARKKSSARRRRMPGLFTNCKIQAFSCFCINSKSYFFIRRFYYESSYPFSPRIHHQLPRQRR